MASKQWNEDPKLEVNGRPPPNLPVTTTVLENQDRQTGALPGALASEVTTDALPDSESSDSTCSNNLDTFGFSMKKWELGIKPNSVLSTVEVEEPGTASESESESDPISGGRPASELESVVQFWQAPFPDPLYVFTPHTVHVTAVVSPALPE